MPSDAEGLPLCAGGAFMNGESGRTEGLPPCPLPELAPPASPAVPLGVREEGRFVLCAGGGVPVDDR